MGSQSACQFCKRLPELSRRCRGRETRCPVCKSNVFVDATGNHHRLPEGGIDGLPTPSALPLPALAASAGLLLALSGAAWWLWPRSAEISPTEIAVNKTQTPAITIVARPRSESMGETHHEANEQRSMARQGGPRWTLPAKFGPGKLVVAQAKPYSYPPPFVERTINQFHVVPTLSLTSAPAHFQWDSRFTHAVEVDLSQMPNSDVSRSQLQSRILKKNHESVDGFIKELQRDEDFDGLPFLLGEKCQLAVNNAKSLMMAAAKIRRALDLYDGQFEASQSTRTQHFHEEFWAVYKRHARDIKVEENVPAFTQIFDGESTTRRMELIDKLHEGRNAETAIALAKMAVFDPDDNVRERALTRLVDRIKTADEDTPEMDAVLRKGLRYPMLPVVRNAALTVLRLKRASLGKELVAALAEADPRMPTHRMEEGKVVHRIPTLVRINHLRNCQLCHAPSTSRQDLVRGVVPTPGKALPPSRTLYYNPHSDVIVKAEVTYLRQDFSINLPVGNPNNWPALQRFDFLIQNRRVTADKAAQQRKDFQGHTEYHELILATLEAMTGARHAYDINAWRREVVAMSHRERHRSAQHAEATERRR